MRVISGEEAGTPALQKQCIYTHLHQMLQQPHRQGTAEPSAPAPYNNIVVQSMNATDVTQWIFVHLH